MNDQLEEITEVILSSTHGVPIRAVKLLELQFYIYGSELALAARAFGVLAMLAYIKCAPANKLKGIAKGTTRSGMAKELLDFYLPKLPVTNGPQQFAWQLATTDLKQELEDRQEQSVAASKIIEFSYRYAKHGHVENTRRGGSTMAIAIIEKHRSEFKIRKGTRTIEALWAQFKSIAPLIYLLEECPELDLHSGMLMSPYLLSEELIESVTKRKRRLVSAFSRYNEVVLTLRQNGYTYDEIAGFDAISSRTQLAGFPPSVQTAIRSYQTKRTPKKNSARKARSSL